MNRLYIFFPHCYIKATDNELLIYDTMKFKSIYMRDIDVSCKTVNTLNRFGYMEDCNDNKCILQKFNNNDFGYFIHHSKLIPYIPERKIRITTSLSKENKALGHNLASYTNMMLKSITLLLNNTLSTCLNSFAYKQLEYPYINCSIINVDAILLQLNSFNIERIILSGEISYSKLDKFLEYAHKKNILVIYRVYYLAYPIQYIQDIIHKYKSIMIELLVDSDTPLNIMSLKEERLILKYIITNSSDLEKLGDMEENVVLCPIILEKGRKTLQPQMILTKNEILQSCQTLKECYIKDYINISCFGHLTINYDGMVYCLTQQIESLQNQDLACIINKWVGSQDCLWYFTRKNKSDCKNCALQVLCPSISIYEQLSAYKCPCMV